MPAEHGIPGAICRMDEFPVFQEMNDIRIAAI